MVFTVSFVWVLLWIYGLWEKLKIQHVNKLKKLYKDICAFWYAVWVRMLLQWKSLGIFIRSGVCLCELVIAKTTNTWNIFFYFIHCYPQKHKNVSVKAMLPLSLGRIGSHWDIQRKRKKESAQEQRRENLLNWKWSESWIKDQMGSQKLLLSGTRKEEGEGGDEGVGKVEQG